MILSILLMFFGASTYPVKVASCILYDNVVLIDTGSMELTIKLSRMQCEESSRTGASVRQSGCRVSGDTVYDYRLNMVSGVSSGVSFRRYYTPYYVLRGSIWYYGEYYSVSELVESGVYSRTDRWDSSLVRVVPGSYLDSMRTYVSPGASSDMSVMTKILHDELKSRDYNWYSVVYYGVNLYDYVRGASPSIADDSYLLLGEVKMHRLGSPSFCNKVLSRVAIELGYNGDVE